MCTKGVETCCPEKLKSDLIQNQACSPYAIAWLPLKSLSSIGDFRFEYTSTRRTFQLYSAGFTSSIHISILSHELPSLPKTNTKSEHKRHRFEIETHTRTSSRTSSPI